MSQDTKELAEIKGYVARLYQMVRGRTQMALELTEEQTEQTAGVGETIDEINTNLQIARENKNKYDIAWEKIFGKKRKKEPHISELDSK